MKSMTPRMFVGYMVNQSKLGGFEVSRRLGKAQTYINRYTNGGSIPSLALAAQIAKVCGYEVHIIGRGEDITVEVADEQG